MTTKIKQKSRIDFPEKEYVVGNIDMTFYGKTSYASHMAVLSHYLHNRHRKISNEEKAEIEDAIRDYLSQKETQQRIELKDRLDNEVLKVAEDPAQYSLFSEFFNVPFPVPENPKYTFVDLFAGIGGIRIPFDEMNYHCVFSSEWDAKACQTYFANFGTVPFGDITKIPAERIPQHDILLAGFPCQAFSIMGKMQGFADTRGTMFLNAA